MKQILLILLCGLYLPFLQSQEKIKGLIDEVEIFTDPFGIAHIYANNEKDLFFAQGYNAAKDRLFQFEIWRRQTTGTVAEILGPRELKRDIGTRLFKFRGNLDDEMNYYHPNGKLIIESFVAGVNAYIENTKKKPSLLPMEFKLLGITPQKWTPADVISRHQGLLGNIRQELNHARQVSRLGVEKTKEINWFHPQDPDLTIDPKINQELLFDDILELYLAYRRPVRFQPNDLISSVRNSDQDFYNLALTEDTEWDQVMEEEVNDIGSNNWEVDGSMTESGYPIMANDPHRSLAAPSLRYMVHLNAPGWNVVGGGEPEIPGISIGHNEHGAWGLTVFRTDAEDLYVYETNPKNSKQYKYKDQWVNMESIQDEIPIKGQRAHKVEHLYTRHGPVVYQDEKNNVAYAVRCGWLEIGGSPYLASLRMDQAKTFEEFQEACKYSHIPGENMIWADKEGNIGWQAVGIAPVRKNFSGLVPVPGDGQYEWDGYLPMLDKPHVKNPESGFWLSANANVTPREYKHWDAIGFSWSDPYRTSRLIEMINTGNRHNMADMTKYQTDYLSKPASIIVPMLKHLKLEGALKEAADILFDWNFHMTKDAKAPTIYAELESALKNLFEQEKISDYDIRQSFNPQTKKVIDWLLFEADRETVLKKALQMSLEIVQKRLGKDSSDWVYGQLKNKHVKIIHPLSAAVNDSLRAILEVGPAPRGGYSMTVGNTSNSLNQRSGASFRFISDTGNWDHCLGMNSPGQSGDPAHPNYRNLFDMWVTDQFFPVYFSRDKIEAVSKEKVVLKP